MKKSILNRALATVLTVLMVMGACSLTVFAENAVSTQAAADTDYSIGDSFGINNYYKVVAEDEWTLVPGAAIEKEIVVNNASGTRRQVMHVIEVDPSNPDVSIIPGYYNIDKDVFDVANQQASKLTDMATYYENNLGYNIVGGINTDLYYAANAPRVLVYNGEDLRVFSATTPKTVLCVYKNADGTVYCDIKPYKAADITAGINDGTLLHAVGALFGMIIQDGELVSKTVERSSAVARSMIGIKEDGTLVMCMNDGRDANNSIGFSDYEEGESMLALGCKWAANCDGGGSATFLSKRVGEDSFTMRSVPCDGAERPTVNGVFITSNVGATGIFDEIVVESDYDFVAPGSTYTFSAKAVDTHGYAMEMPENVEWALSDASFGTISNGAFTSNGKLGAVDAQVLVNGVVKGSTTITVVNPQTFGFTSDQTTIPYGKSMELEIAATYGADNKDVYLGDRYSIALSDNTAATVEGDVITVTTDETKTSVNVTLTYLPVPTLTSVITVNFGKGSEIIYDFEDGTTSGFVGFDEARQWCIENSVNNTIVGNAPHANQYSAEVDSRTFVSSVENGGEVKNGDYALAWSVDNTSCDFSNWTYNIIYNIGETYVLRDVENGKYATTLGMWLYIPEGASGLAFQSQLYTKKADGSLTHWQSHFTFTTVNGTVKNLNSCSEADIPESRWVYATVDLTGYDYVCTPVATYDTNNRTPSFIRTYIKPTVPAVHTFYIDDITLDYSSAIEDRVLPTITDVSYAISDSAVALSNNAIINSEKVAFSATVADNAKLDTASAKILIDGNALDNVSVNSGKFLVSDQVNLTAGVHTVTFEICDTLGNLARVTRTFTVQGEAAITLTGHNDSGELAETDSIYYVDINTSDIADINSLTAQLKLQNANSWEPQGIEVAKGFSATYSLNEVSNVVTVTVERTGDAIDSTAETIVSIPVRLWSWSAYNHVTGTEISATTQFASANCPIVTIDCKVLTGTVQWGKNHSGYENAFGGNISVTTKINDNVNPWHTHDANLTVLNKAAQCGVKGYTGRTYCESCKSVIDWGEETAALEHNYQIENGTFGCSNCDAIMDTTGLIEYNGKTYYAIAGNLQSKWKQVGDSWYYFHYSDYYGFSGTYGINEYFGFPVKGSYTFEDGKLLSGIWSNDNGRYKYYYGPSYYVNGWKTIDNQQYYFDKEGYCLTGYQLICPNKNDPTPTYYMYHFSDSGVSDGLVTGIVNNIYYKDGLALEAGLIKIDNALYYVKAGGWVVTSDSRYVPETAISEDVKALGYTAGVYTFDAEGKYVIKNGIVNGTYYENDKPVEAGLIKIDNVLYYVKAGGWVVTNGSRFVPDSAISAEVKALGFTEGVYTFDAEGKYVIKNGIVNGTYYENDKPVEAGLIKIDNALYYVKAGGWVVTNGSRYVPETAISAEVSELGFTAGVYAFDAEGKYVIKNGIVNGTYYENDKPVEAGLIKIDNALYYVKAGGWVVTDGSRYVPDTAISDEVRALGFTAGVYAFDAEGKYVLKNGIVDGYYYENGKAVEAGLVRVDGSIYYVKAGGWVVTGGSRFVPDTAISTELKREGYVAGVYTFGATGALI